MSLRVYVAAPYDYRQEVREIHRDLVTVEIVPTASWVLSDLEEQSLELANARAWLQNNDKDAAQSHAMLVVGLEGRGGEMFCEVGRALSDHMPVVWTGRRVLSTNRPGVVYAHSLADAYRVLLSWASIIDRNWAIDVEWGRLHIWETVLDADAEVTARGAA